MYIYIHMCVCLSRSYFHAFSINHVPSLGCVPLVFMRAVVLSLKGALALAATDDRHVCLPIASG